MHKFRIIFICWALCLSNLLWAKENLPDALSPKSIFQGNLLWTYGTETSVIYTPSDYHNYSLGHATQMFDLIRRNASNFPGMKQELLLEAISLPYFSQIIHTPNLDFSSIEKKDPLTTRKMVSLLFNSSSPEGWIRDSIDQLTARQKSLLQEILTRWEDSAFQKYKVHVKIKMTYKEYVSRLTEEQNIVFFGYYISSLTQKMTQKGANTYFFVSPSPGIVNEALQEKKKGTVKEILYPGPSGQNFNFENNEEIRFLGLPLSFELIEKSRNTGLKEAEDEILREKIKLFKQIFPKALLLPSWLRDGKWLVMNTKEPDRMRDFLPCCRNENRANDKVCEVIFHVEHKTLSLHKHLIEFTSLPEAFYHGLYGQLPFYSFMDGTFYRFSDKKGTVEEVPSSSPDLFPVKNVFYDIQRELYYIYNHEKDSGSLFTPLYLKKVPGERNIYELAIFEQIKSIPYFHENIRKPVRVELNEDSLETVILNTPGLSPSTFKALIHFGNKNNHAQKTINLVSGTTTWMESLLLNAPALISGYDNDEIFYKNIKDALKQASLPEETQALHQWIKAQDSLFEPDTKTEIRAKSFVKAFGSVHKIFLRLLGNPDYSMPENFARILEQTTRKEFDLSS